MRIVDIFYKNIEGQLSEAKGNLNVIGHLMMMHNEYNNAVSVTSGYFEVDGSTIKNAHANYNELYKSLVSSVTPGNTMAWTLGSDIILNSKPALLGVKAASGGHSGLLNSETFEPHSHSYLHGNEYYTPTHTTSLKDKEAFYSLRFFIYHGVH